MSFLSDYTEKNSNLIPKIDIPCFAWNSQAEQGLLFFKAKSLSYFKFMQTVAQTHFSHSKADFCEMLPDTLSFREYLFADSYSFRGQVHF